MVVREMEGIEAVGSVVIPVSQLSALVETKRRK
jgi:hypothetical protein